MPYNREKHTTPSLFFTVHSSQCRRHGITHHCPQGKAMNGMNLNKTNGQLYLHPTIPAGSGIGSFKLSELSLSYRPNSASDAITIPITLPAAQAEFTIYPPTSIIGMDYTEHLLSKNKSDSGILKVSKTINLIKNITQDITGTLSLHLNRLLPQTNDVNINTAKCSIETQFVQLTTDVNGNSVEIPITNWRNPGTVI